jgi:hypothetical protein
MPSILLSVKGTENVNGGNRKREKEMEIGVITPHLHQLAATAATHHLTIIIVIPIRTPSRILTILTTTLIITI